MRTRTWNRKEAKRAYNLLEQNKDDENEMKKAIKYMDSIVTTINPEINAAIPVRHPCQKRSDETKDNSQQDYIELINKLQRHTRCSPLYCLRVNKRTVSQGSQ
jgi:hypothetical protein